MTKKRFVKLMMAHGIQRNEACKIAITYSSQNISYSYAYMDYFLKSSFRSIGETFRRFYEELKEVILNFNAMKEGLKNDGKNLHKG